MADMALAAASVAEWAMEIAVEASVEPVVGRVAQVVAKYFAEAGSRKAVTDPIH